MNKAADSVALFFILHIQNTIYSKTKIYEKYY